MKEKILHRKESFVITTIEAIDELGIQAITTKEIARREGVSEATLFRHFKNKNELLLAVLDFFAKFDNDLYLSTRLMNLEPVESIMYIESALTEYYENYPQITVLTQLFDVLRYEPTLKEKVVQIYNTRTNHFKQLIEEAQEKGQLRSDINSQEVYNLMNGYLRETTLRWRFDSYEFSLKREVVCFIQILLNALKN